MAILVKILLYSSQRQGENMEEQPLEEGEGGAGLTRRGWDAL